MTTFALIHGAWGSGWHWAGVPRELERMGHGVVAPDLPCEDPNATFSDYADVVLDALQDIDGNDVVVVGYSMGGTIAALVAARRPVRELVYIAAVIPEPGMSLNDELARGDEMLLPEWIAGVELSEDYSFSHWVDFDVYRDVGCHDCEEPIARERFERLRRQAHRPYGEPSPLTHQPDVPTRYVLCSEDRLMNNPFWRNAVRARLATEPLELPGSHSPMASRPKELARLLAGDTAAPTD